MSSNERDNFVGVHKAEVVAAVAFASLSFGAFSKAEKERALAERLGPKNPAYEQVISRVDLPEAFGKTFGTTAIIVGAMGLSGLRRTRRST